jgi:hypothetical protein
LLKKKKKKIEYNVNESLLVKKGFVFTKSYGSPPNIAQPIPLVKTSCKRNNSQLSRIFMNSQLHSTDILDSSRVRYVSRSNTGMALIHMVIFN